MALILKEIWSDRNLALHKSSPITCHLPSMPFTEGSMSSPGSCLFTSCTYQCWPTLDSSSPVWVKINVDAAISTSHACLTAVARDHLGVPIKILARITKVASPLLAESEALLWAVQLAIREGWNYVIFEGDAKSCFDAVNSPDLPSPWIIRTSTENILALHSSFVFCYFVCGRRACNSAAHEVVKFALNSFSSFSTKAIFPPCRLYVRKIIESKSLIQFSLLHY